MLLIRWLSVNATRFQWDGFREEGYSSSLFEILARRSYRAANYVKTTIWFSWLS